MTKLGTARPFIIAEIGSNWRDLHDAIDSIGQVATLGAHAVKFQAFDSLSLYGLETHPPVNGIPLEWLPTLKVKADACGIELMCTAFSPALVAAVDPFVSVHKIASSDNTWPELYEAVNATGKPVIISCGAAGLRDIAELLPIIKAPVYLLYCSASYPARYHNLFAMEDMRRYGKPIGLSDHSLDVIYTPLSAVKHFGAEVIEKHVNFIDGLDSPDAAHSLNATEFKSMCDYLLSKTALSYDAKPREERAMYLRHNRRLIATKPISIGDKLESGVNFGAFRSLVDSTSGLMPSAARHVTGKSATKAKEPGQSIGPSDFA